jgi:DNA-binding SARP family transcriptional activator
MLALHRAGRQHDALAAARRFRATLADEQGLDPSRALPTR